MRCYEHTFIARQDLSPQQAQALAETYSGLVVEHGGEVTKNEYWGLRNLAYRMRKNRKGHYVHLNLRADAAAINELERLERLSDDILRYLTVKVDELDDAPSVLMHARTSREERSRRHDDGRRGRDDDRPRDRDRDDRPRRDDAHSAAPDTDSDAEPDTDETPTAEAAASS